MSTWDAQQFVTDYHIQHWTAGNNVSPGWVNIRCPMCSDQSNHGGFNPSGGYYHCWKCGGHAIPAVIRALLGGTWDDARTIADSYDGYLADHCAQLRKKPQGKRIELPGGPLESMHRRYLRGRGFKPSELARKYGIQGTGVAGDWKYRIIIPIYYRGQLVAYQGRDITGKARLRYKTLDVESCVVDPKHILYNLDNCQGATIGVVEGVFDAWKMGDGIAATLGTAMTKSQIRILSGYSRVLFIFDPEPEAQARAQRSAEALAALGIDVEVVNTELDHDPGDMTPDEVQGLRRELGI